MKLISVVIPVYNIENYILDCIKSLESQSLSKSAFEVIVINDCSSDQTITILEQYRTQLDIQILHLTKNSGPGIARNKGITQACGEYILFLDGDDFLHPESLKILSNHIYANPTDLVSFNWTYMANISSHPLKKDVGMRRDLNKVILEKEALVKCYLGMNMDGSVIYTLVKKALLIKNKISFPAGLHEDMSVIFKIYYLAENISVLEDIVYIKRDRENSIINTITNKHLIGYLGAWPLIFNFLIEKEGDSSYAKYSPYYYSGMSGLICTQIVKIMKAYPESQEQRCLLFQSIINILNGDKYLKKPYSENFPQVTKKDKITTIFFMSMKNNKISYSKRAQLFENSLNLLEHSEKTNTY